MGKRPSGIIKSSDLKQPTKAVADESIVLDESMPLDETDNKLPHFGANGSLKPFFKDVKTSARTFVAVKLMVAAILGFTADGIGGLVAMMLLDIFLLCPLWSHLAKKYSDATINNNAWFPLVGVLALVASPLIWALLAKPFNIDFENIPTFLLVITFFPLQYWIILQNKFVAPGKVTPYNYVEEQRKRYRSPQTDPSSGVFYYNNHSSYRK